ncbi:hypothetical protein [Paracraurococcus lichenis]|uniref:Uncharacterized protein n=1 Tax=Paracraurococcus lichenis TaxID=3064888 RepID=A0ABT9E3J1_9PROT|nr:hypothetical protein [Paracraurococcus sp. LOR1-02]MDO9710565.1 hypothetical protein [Paracraurococcus sp. LOR1-02]
MTRITILTLCVAFALIGVAAITTGSSAAKVDRTQDPDWLLAFDTAWNAPRTQGFSMPRNTPHIRGW